MFGNNFIYKSPKRVTGSCLYIFCAHTLRICIYLYIYISLASSYEIALFKRRKKAQDFLTKPRRGLERFFSFLLFFFSVKNCVALGARKFNLYSSAKEGNE